MTTQELEHANALHADITRLAQTLAELADPLELNPLQLLGKITRLITADFEAIQDEDTKTSLSALVSDIKDSYAQSLQDSKEVLETAFEAIGGDITTP